MNKWGGEIEEMGEWVAEEGGGWRRGVVEKGGWLKKGGGWRRAVVEEGGGRRRRKGLDSYFELVSYFDSICILIEIIVFVLIIILFWSLFWFKYSQYSQLLLFYIFNLSVALFSE